jgi:acyl-CoA synthetase (AMP-forming)/AMP-acid ligase II
MNLWTLIERAADLHGDQVAVVDPPLRLTYRALRDRSEALARALHAHGIGVGDRVAILDVNSSAYLEAYFAAAALGAILVPLNHRLAPPELADILVDAGARALLFRSRFHAAVARLRADVPTLALRIALDATPVPVEGALDYEDLLAAGGPAFPLAPRGDDAVAHLYYTSGTTGRPKGVMLTHRNVATHALGTLAELQLTDADVWGHVAPMFHLADAWAVFAITWVGGRHVILPTFEAGTALEAIPAHGITITNLIPTMLNLMVKHPRAGEHDYRSLRLVLSGGAPIAPAVVRAIVDRFGCTYVQTYGMTETSPYLTLSLLKAPLRQLDPDARLAYQAKTGRPFVTVELRVVRPDGRPVAPDEREVGEIQVRGDTVTPGYWNRPDETATAFEDGWLRTGDLAVIDAEGYVTIVDRLKDMILTGGENVYSTEVEHVLYQHPAVLEAAVYGVPHETWGEAVTAAVVLRPGETVPAEALVAFCRERLAGYKVPKAIRYLEELPKTGSGKIQKAQLRELARTEGAQ